MKSIKLLLVSFTITVIALMTISPANAKPAVKIQHIKVNNFLTTKFNSYDIIKVASQVPNNLSNRYSNSFSTGLILSNPAALSEKSSQVTMNVINKSNDFFTSAMVFNDRLHQFISYFSTASNENISKKAAPLSESEVIKKKCSSTLSFS